MGQAIEKAAQSREGSKQGLAEIEDGTRSSRREMRSGQSLSHTYLLKPVVDSLYS